MYNRDNLPRFMGIQRNYNTTNDRLLPLNLYTIAVTKERIKFIFYEICSPIGLKDKGNEFIFVSVCIKHV